MPSSSSGLLTTTSRPARTGGRLVVTPRSRDGARMKLSCGRRRSRLAVRTIRQMKRYSRTRNAILRISSAVSTATELITGGTFRFPRTPSTGPLRGRALRASFPLAVEGDPRRAEHDRVSLAQLRALHALAVDLRSVRRTEIDDPVRRTFLTQLGVTTRDVC